MNAVGIAAAAATAIAARTTARTSASTAPGAKRRRDTPRHSRPHSQAITAPTSAVNTSAEIIRWRRPPCSTRANARPVAALARGIFGDCPFEIALAEIGPQGRGEDQLGIGALPQQKIADALFAAGPDQQVGVGQ